MVLRLVRFHFGLASLATTALLTIVPSRSSGAGGSPVPSATQQLLLVHAVSWSSAWGELNRYERDGAGEWKLVGAPVSVDLGRNGMAWGRGLHAMPSSGPRKTEGDGKSPAGVFALDRAFGIASQLPDQAQGFPYLSSESTTYCVEDVRSEHYNRIVDST